MHLRKQSGLIAAVIAACTSITAKAAVITYFYDSNIQVSTDDGATFSPAVVSGTPLNMTVQINPGDYIAVGVDGSITGNANPAAGGAYATAHPGVVPANLGIAEFQIGMTDSNQSVAQVQNAGSFNGTAPVGNSYTTAKVNPNFTANFSGLLDGLGGVTASDGTIGQNSPQAATSAALSYGTQTGGSPLFGNMILGGTNGPITALGATTFSLTATSPNQAYFTNSTAVSSNSAPAYANTAAGKSDSIVLGSLTVSVVPGPPQPVISLYGNEHFTRTTPNATLDMSGSGYTTRISPSVATGYATTTGLLPGSVEVYALKLKNASGTISPSNTALLDGIVADINGENGNPASLNVTASLVSGSYSSEFPGYDILLTSDDGFTSNGTSQLSFDFSALGSGNAADEGLTVTGIGAVSESVSAVPEPTAVFSLVAGSCGALLSRRMMRNRAA